jgi:hypothetical protein
MSVPSSELGPPSPDECVSPFEPNGGEQHSLGGDGVWVPNSDDRIESLALCILCGL